VNSSAQGGNNIWRRERKKISSSLRELPNHPEAKRGKVGDFPNREGGGGSGGGAIPVR